MRFRETLRTVGLTLCLLSAACAKLFPPPNTNKSGLNQGANSNATSTTSHSPTTAEIKITQPADGSTVVQTQTVKGTSQNLPDGQVIWVVASTDGSFYPQNDAAVMQADGKWSAITYLGKQPPEDAGRAFEIFAVLADKQAQAAFNNYLSMARGKSNSPGLGRLPPGAQVYDQVSVTRR